MRAHTHTRTEREWERELLNLLALQKKIFVHLEERWAMGWEKLRRNSTQRENVQGFIYLIILLLKLLVNMADYSWCAIESSSRGLGVRCSAGWFNSWSRQPGVVLKPGLWQNPKSWFCFVWHLAHSSGKTTKKSSTQNKTKTLLKSMMQRGAMEKPDDVHPSFAWWPLFEDDSVMSDKSRGQGSGVHAALVTTATSNMYPHDYFSTSTIQTDYRGIRQQATHRLLLYNWLYMFIYNYTTRLSMWFAHKHKAPVSADTQHKFEKIQ